MQKVFLQGCVRGGRVGRKGTYVGTRGGEEVFPIMFLQSDLPLPFSSPRHITIWYPPPTLLSFLPSSSHHASFMRTPLGGWRWQRSDSGGRENKCSQGEEWAREKTGESVQGATYARDVAANAFKGRATGREIEQSFRQGPRSYCIGSTFYVPFQESVFLNTFLPLTLMGLKRMNSVSLLAR